MLACQNGHEACARLLLVAGADANQAEAGRGAAQGPGGDPGRRGRVGDALKGRARREGRGREWTRSGGVGGLVWIVL